VRYAALLGTGVLHPCGIINVVDKRLRLAVALAWGALLVMSLYDYDGNWRLLPLGVVIVGGIIQVTEARLRNKDDELTTLKLSGR
jgi:hypothetical protein